MRVALVTQWFSCKVGGLNYEIAQALRRRGFEVEVVAGRSRALNAQRGMDHRRRTVEDGLTVHRTPFYFSHDESPVRRFATYGSFAATSALAAPRILAGVDAVLVYASPATTAAPAIVARQLHGTPYVLMVQDVWPDSVFATGFLQSGAKYRAARGVLDPYMAVAYRNASAVTGLSPGMRDLLISRGTDPERTHVIYNWVNESLTPRIEVPAREPGEPLHLMYAGNFGLAQGLDNVLTAISALPRGSVKVTLIGNGAARGHLQRITGELDLSASVTFHDWMPREHLPAMAATAHLHLVSLADEDIFRITIPSKFQSLLAMGAPVLAVAAGEVPSVVSRTGSGLTAPPGDAKALTEVLHGALELDSASLRAMGANAHATYWDMMSEADNGERLAQIVRQAAEEGRSRARARQAP